VSAIGRKKTTADSKKTGRKGPELGRAYSQKKRIPGQGAGKKQKTSKRKNNGKTPTKKRGRQTANKTEANRIEGPQSDDKWGSWGDFGGRKRAPLKLISQEKGKGIGKDRNRGKRTPAQRKGGQKQEAGNQLGNREAVMSLAGERGRREERVEEPNRPGRGKIIWGHMEKTGEKTYTLRTQPGLKKRGETAK